MAARTGKERKKQEFGKLSEPARMIRLNSIYTWSEIFTTFWAIPKQQKHALS